MNAKELIREMIAEAILEAKGKKGMRSVKYGADDNPDVTKMDFLPAKVLKQIANEQELDEVDDELDERKKRKKSPRVACWITVTHSLTHTKVRWQRVIL